MLLMFSVVVAECLKKELFIRFTERVSAKLICLYISFHFGFKSGIQGLGKTFLFGLPCMSFVN